MTIVFLELKVMRREDFETDEAFETAIKAEMHRNKRVQLLLETDVYGLSDVTMSDDMKTYRQALRDLPETTKDKWPNIEDSDWPTKP
mgnify:CR=1 FL=1